jgi:hypothetical protein
VDRSGAVFLRPYFKFYRIPASFGLLLISRSAGLISLAQDFSWRADLAAGAISLIIVLLAVFLPSNRLMRLGCLGLLLGGYLSQTPTSVLNLAILFLLPGVILLWEPESKNTALIKLIIAGIGLFPLPFLPAWMGLIQFGGIASYFLAAAYGVLISRIFIRSYQKWQEAESSLEAISTLEMIGLGVILISQYLIAIQFGLFGEGLRFGNIPISAWMAPLFLVLGAFLWIRLPARELPQGGLLGEKNKSSISQFGSLLTTVSGEIVHLMTRLFEGDGGLIWTLLLAFLIFSLASLGGG